MWCVDGRVAGPGNTNLSVKALLVLFQWTDMSEAALLIRLFTSYLSWRVADLPAA